MFSKQVAQKLVPLVQEQEALEALHQELAQATLAALVVETSAPELYRLQGRLALLETLKNLPSIVTDVLEGHKQMEQADQAWKDSQ
jgi:hypothetical protein